MIRIKIDGQANAINFPTTVQLTPFRDDPSNLWRAVTVGTAGTSILDVSTTSVPDGFYIKIRNTSTGGQIIWIQNVSAPMIDTTQGFPIYPGEFHEFYNILPGALSAVASAAGGELRLAVLKS